MRVLALTVAVLALSISGPWVVRRIADRLRRSCRRVIEAWRSRPPRRTLRCVPRSAESNWWEIDTLDGCSALKLVSDWHVTNISSRAVRIVGAGPSWPAWEGTRLIRSTVTVQRPEGGVFGDFEIPPGVTVAALVESWFPRPAREPAGCLITRHAFVDSLGNRHIVKGVSFQPGVQMHDVRRATAFDPMSPDSATRRHVRANVSFRADLLIEGREATSILARGHCRVLSAGGACLELDQDHAIARTARLRFRLPATGGDISCTSVVRNRLGRVIGVEFADLCRADSDQIDAFVRHQPARSTGHG